MKKIMCLPGHGFLDDFDISDLLEHEFSQCEIIVPGLFKENQWIYPQEAIPYMSPLRKPTFLESQMVEHNTLQ
jgi:hypothetical protein